MVIDLTESDGESIATEGADLSIFCLCDEEYGKEATRINDEDELDNWIEVTIKGGDSSKRVIEGG